ncbi:DNA modification methylase [candidate division WOR-3 bacterium JGI_Cruoil_03_44_89]|uniref:DNA modification methylase n=1 Tax=candidate division WOR-3 bacterium JGI_Cruoil_03_44_89 TaxID=1973748 RepID=A0A235BZB4_UNCW3|nr:MAG: DNA modification methylase [candidate division WOR-3 bacterium JGI_Cruoil_03_44_89]
MTFEDLKRLYLKKREQLGDETYKHISELLEEAKEIHKRDWLKHPTPNRDHEQSWRAFKGKNLEKLVQYIITDEVEELGLQVINGNKLERTTNLSRELSQVKRNLAIDYGEFGLHLPDVDIIIYNPQSYKVLAAISSKVTLRERIAQTGYWKLKLLQDEATKHIKVYFITPDEDGTLTHKKPTKKGRAIVEIDLDGSYVLSEEEVEESDKVKLFEHFVEDLKRLLDERQ